MTLEVVVSHAMLNVMTLETVGIDSSYFLFFQIRTKRSLFIAIERIHIYSPRNTMNIYRAASFEKATSSEAHVTVGMKSNSNAVMQS